MKKETSRPVQKKRGVFLTPRLIPLTLFFLLFAFSCSVITPSDEEEPVYYSFPYKVFSETDGHGVHKEGTLWMDIYSPGSGLKESINDRNLQDWADELFSSTLSIAEVPRIPVVVVHGGAWNIGSTLPTIFGKWWTLIKHYRYRVFVVEYRLSGCEPEAEQLVTEEKICWPHPAPVEDIRDAVAFIKVNSQNLGVDPRRVILVGDSAGAHLALLHAIRESRPEREDILPCLTTSSIIPITQNPHCDTSVAGVASFYAPVDFELLLDDESNLFALGSIANYLGTDAGTLRRIIEGDRDVDPEILQRYQEADIYQNLHSGIPPIFFSHSNGDTVVPALSVLRVEEKIRQITAAEAYWMNEIKDDYEIPLLDISSWEVGLPHSYMWAMAASGNTFYLEEEAGRLDLSSQEEDESYLEEQLDIMSDPMETLHELDKSLRNWIDRIDTSLN